MSKKLEVAERYSWYIIEAFYHRIAELKKTIKDAEENIANPGDNCPPILLQSLKNCTEHCQRLLEENTRVLRELKDAGWE